MVLGSCYHTSSSKVPSKHPHSEFLEWMVQLLQTTDPLVVYTEEWLVPTLQQLAVGGHTILHSFTPGSLHPLMVSLRVPSPERFPDSGEHPVRDGEPLALHGR